MVDIYKDTIDGIDAPAQGAFAITPNDTADFLTDSGAKVTRSVYVGGIGDLRVLTLEGEDIIFYGFSGILPQRIRRVFATNTTATHIVGMY